MEKLRGLWLKLSTATGWKPGGIAYVARRLLALA